MNHFQIERARKGEVAANYFLNKIYKTEEEKKHSHLPNQKEIQKILKESSDMFENLDFSVDHNDNFQNNLNSIYTSWTSSIDFSL